MRPLPLADHQCAAFDVEVAPVQPGQLRPADAGAVERLDHRPIAHPGRGGQVRDRQDRLGLLDGERGLREAFLDFRQLQLARGVRGDVVVADRPLEERPHRQQLRVLAAEAEWFAVGFAVVEQVALVAHQHRPGHLDRLGDPAVGEPGRQLCQALTPGPDRGR